MNFLESDLNNNFEVDPAQIQDPNLIPTAVFQNPNLDQNQNQNQNVSASELHSNVKVVQERKDKLDVRNSVYDSRLSRSQDLDSRYQRKRYRLCVIRREL